MRLSHRWLVIAMALSVLTAGCSKSGSEQSASDENNASERKGWFGFMAPRVTVPSGTTLEVRLAGGISSETSGKGDPWRGVVTNSVFVGDREVIPAGSEIEGVVVGAREARKGDRAMLELQVRTIHVGDRKVSLVASSEPVVAGSTRARNLGAIAGGVAAGALLGKAIGGDGDDAARGAVVGGVVATGAVAASKGYQVVLREGTVMTFVLNQDVAIATG